MRRTLFCVAQGRGDEWEAFCLDLDLAVQGHSFDDVRCRLEEALSAYLESVASETPEVREKLLNRRAPLLVRLRWAWRFFKAALSGREDDSVSTAGFPVPCHA